MEVDSLRRCPVLPVRLARSRPARSTNDSRQARGSLPGPINWIQASTAAFHQQIYSYHTQEIPFNVKCNPCLGPSGGKYANPPCQTRHKIVHLIIQASICKLCSGSCLPLIQLNTGMHELLLARASLLALTYWAFSKPESGPIGDTRCSSGLIAIIHPET